MKLALALLMLSCSGETTPTGPLGADYDLRPLLPGAARGHAPEDSAARSHSAVVTVGQPPAKVSLRWHSFLDGASAYLLSMSFELVQSADGLKLEAAPFGSPENRGTTEAVMQANQWRISWSRRHLGGTTSGVISGYLFADGTLHVQP